MLLFVPQIDFHDSYSEAHSAGDFGTVSSLSSYANYFSLFIRGMHVCVREHVCSHVHDVCVCALSHNVHVCRPKGHFVELFHPPFRGF